MQEIFYSQSLSFQAHWVLTTKQRYSLKQIATSLLNRYKIWIGYQTVYLLRIAYSRLSVEKNEQEISGINIWGDAAKIYYSPCENFSQ